jgi:tRNA (guanine-N7-)-methyltransferase
MEYKNKNMRMRKKKNTGVRIQSCADYMNWNDMLENDKDIYLEIGCGKGDFICGMAQRFPDVNFIALEIISDIIVMAMEKTKSLNLPNVRFINTDAKRLEEYFAGFKISQIYLNFSDPWHKRYQANKRLTSPVFLEIYKKILKPNAKIFMKTDNKNLFDYSLKTLPANGFTVKNMTHDLYNSENFNPNENIQTEYEKNFVSQNIPICYLEATLTSN